MSFELTSPYKPTGDQPRAIQALLGGLSGGVAEQTLLGITGSGKTFTMSNLIAELQRPTLVISHNKTLAAQLATEFRTFFPSASVNYFVSYYDYYQPEAYIPQTDTYIEKETDLNEEIDRLRHSATEGLLTRRDVIVCASVSTIFGLGSPEEYKKQSFTVKKGESIKRTDMLRRLVALQYKRNDVDFHRGTFRIKGDTFDIYLASSDKTFYRLQFFGEEVEYVRELDAVTYDLVNEWEEVTVFPATHYVAPEVDMKSTINGIIKDMRTESAVMEKAGKLLEAQRLRQRVMYDMEMLEETGYVNGIENYSRYFDGRTPGTPPYTLMDFFPKDFLLFIDESHMTVPQIRGMYAGDRSRKEVLIDHGFRLKAAFDNRPLTFPEFKEKVNQVVYVSATPGPYEFEQTKGRVVEQLIRPTGLLDPDIEVRPSEGQIPHLIESIQERVKKHQRVLVTTLTKRMSEDLTEHLRLEGISVNYLHSEVDTMERLEILRDLRTGVYDVIVGINLLREGLDLPEVSLVAILDADKEGFLRSETALVQTMGRAARHVEGHVIMYADKVTNSMDLAIKEINRRRRIQEAHNERHGITPATIKKAILEDRLAGGKKEVVEEEMPDVSKLPKEEINYLSQQLDAQMKMAASELNFERAAILRDQIREIKKVTGKKPKSK